MQTFKIKPDGFKEIRKKVLIRTIPIMLIAGTAGIVISAVNSKRENTDFNTLPIVIPIAAAALGFGLYRGMNKQKALLESFSLTISDPVITREQLNTPEISIYFKEVKEIAKLKNGCIMIKGAYPGDLIAIPPQVENYQQLEKILNDIQPIVVKENISLFKRYPTLMAFLGIGLMLCVYTLDNKIIVALAGTTVVTLMIWSFIKVLQSKNIDSRTKRASWWLILVLASIIAVMIFKLTGLKY